MKTLTEFRLTLGKLMSITNRDLPGFHARYGDDIMIRIVNLVADIYAKDIEIEKLENEIWAEMEEDI